MLFILSFSLFESLYLRNMHGTGKEESSPHSALADYRNGSQIARQMGSVTWFKPRLTQALRVDCKNWNSSRAILVGCIFNEEIPPEDILVRKWFTQNVWRHSASSCSSSERSSSSSYLPDHPESKADADMSASCTIVIIVLAVDPFYLYHLMWVMIGRNLIFILATCLLFALPVTFASENIECSYGSWRSNAEWFSRQAVTNNENGQNLGNSVTL